MNDSKIKSALRVMSKVYAEYHRLSRDKSLGVEYQKRMCCKAEAVYECQEILKAYWASQDDDPPPVEGKNEKLISAKINPDEWKDGKK